MPLVEKVGSGRPVICIHGTPGDRQTWSRVARLRPDGYELWFVELVDHGEAPDSQDGFVAYERDVEEIARAATQPLILGALSVGGTLAVRVANRLGDRVARIVACAGVVDFSPEERELRVGAIRDLRAGQTPATLFAPFVDAFVPPEERDAETERIIARIESQSAARLTRAIERILEIGDSVRAEPYATPTTLLHARGDMMVPFKNAERLLALGANAKLVALDSRSHMLPLSHANDVARHLFAD